MAVDQLTELAQSYVDLRWHLDPVAASRAGIRAYDDRFGRFAADALRPHIAALKALTGALEELEPDTLDAEIDQTALLNDVRVQLYRYERERVFARDPTQWVQRIVEGASAARLGDLAGFLDDARAALVEPVGFLAAVAMDLLPAAVRAVQQAAAGTDAPQEAERAALAALAALRDQLERWMEGRAGHIAVGEDAFNFHLHYEHALRDTAPELWRYAHRLIDNPPADLGAAFPVHEPPVNPSLVRRTVRAPVTVDGWELCRDPAPERLRRHAVSALLDIGLHTRGMDPEQGVALLQQHLEIEPAEAMALVRRVAANPTYGLTAIAGWREWLALRGAYRGTDFPAAVRPYGALPVSLIRWGLGLGE